MNFDKIDVLVEISNQDSTAPRFLEDIQEFHLGQLGKHNYYRFLYQTIMIAKPKYCLEIGIQYAIGSAYMCVAANSYGGKVIGIDILDRRGFIAENNTFGSNIYSNYTFLNIDSRQAENEFRKIVSPGDLGLVFQDSSHHYNASCEEWNIYSKYLSANAIWICDDITPSFYNTDVDPLGKGMVQYFEGLPGNKKLYKDVLHFGNIMGVILL